LYVTGVGASPTPPFLLYVRVNPVIGGIILTKNIISKILLNFKIDAAIVKFK